MYESESVLWMRGLKLPAWASFLAFFVAMVLFFCAFFGHGWYVVPRECIEPPTSYLEKQGRSCHINFGLFRLCHRGHCKYNLRVNYMVVGQIPYKEIQQAYEKYLSPVRGIEIIAFIFVVLSLIAFCTFLAGFNLSSFFGLVAGGLQILSGILIIIGCALFGRTFRGPTDALPFGWSFWMAIVTASVFIINGVFIGLIGLAAVFKYNRQKLGRASSLENRFGFFVRS